MQQDFIECKLQDSFGFPCFYFSIAWPVSLSTKMRTRVTLIYNFISALRTIFYLFYPGPKYLCLLKEIV